MGHNPLGALSVVAMLGLLAVQGLAGLFANDAVANTGPLYGWVSPAMSDRLTSIHHLNADALLVLIGLHLAAVLWYALVRREPLVKAMITGRRNAPPHEEIADSRLLRAALIVAALALALACLIRAAPPPRFSPF